MRGLRAALGKDLRLFRNGTGLFCLLLPLALLLALRAGGGGLTGQAYLKPFPIALRDEDNTLMSRSLISQMGEVELFSQIVLAGEEPDEALLEGGCAAVVTLPKDFFYTLYDMRENTVRVALNGDMPLESALFRSVFASVMEIISADQAAGRAVFRFCYGELASERERELWHVTAQQLIQDALGRQQVFDGASQASDLQGSLERGALACVLSMLCLFFPLVGVKTLPEELHSGVLPRFLAAGGNIGALFLSKLIVSALAALPALALILAAFHQADWPLVLLEGAVLFFGAFGLFLLAAAWAGEAGAAQRWGNIIMLLSLVLGGAVYPIELMPQAAQLVDRLTLPYYAHLGLETIHAGGGAGVLLVRLWPVLMMGLLCGALAAPVLRGSRRSLAPPAPAIPCGRALPEVVPQPGFLRRLGPVTARKLLAMSGSGAGLCALLAAALLCGTLAGHALSLEGPEHLAIAVSVDRSDPWAAELADRLSAREGVTVAEVSEEEARALLGNGKAEGALLVGAGYGDALAEGNRPPLTYLGAAPAVSVQAAREIVAGLVAGQRARLRGIAEAEIRLERELTGPERTKLLDEMERDAQNAPALYEFTTLSGGKTSAVDPFAPSPLGFAALVVAMTVLTWGAWLGGEDQRRVEDRMASLTGGRSLSYVSDCLALFFAALSAGLCALLPGGGTGPWELLGLAGCTWCAAALALAAVRLTGLAGRVDALAPFLALITCLLGGCFGDLGQLSPQLRLISLCTPQGLALAVGRGSVPALAALLLAGLLLLLSARPGRRRGRVS